MPFQLKDMSNNKRAVMARATAQWVKQSAHKHADPSSDVQHPQKARCSRILLRRADAMTGFKLAVQETRPKNLASDS